MDANAQKLLHGFRATMQAYGKAKRDFEYIAVAIEAPEEKESNKLEEQDLAKTMEALDVAANASGEFLFEHVGALIGYFEAGMKDCIVKHAAECDIIHKQAKDTTQEANAEDQEDESMRECEVNPDKEASVEDSPAVATDEEATTEKPCKRHELFATAKAQKLIELRALVDDLSHRPKYGLLCDLGPKTLEESLEIWKKVVSSREQMEQCKKSTATSEEAKALPGLRATYDDLVITLLQTLIEEPTLVASIFAAGGAKKLSQLLCSSKAAEQQARPQEDGSMMAASVSELLRAGQATMQTRMLRVAIDALILQAAETSTTANKQAKLDLRKGADNHHGSMPSTSENGMAKASTLLQTQQKLIAELTFAQILVRFPK